MEGFRKIDKPGIIVIEAPMGEGKTEAALAAAEIFAAKTGRSGLFFTLPTQATSDGLFPRIEKWMKNLGNNPGDGPLGLRLEHGKSRFNKKYTQLPDARFMICDDSEDDGGAVAAHEWFNARKRGMLSGFVVGTIDHLLV